MMNVLNGKSGTMNNFEKIKQMSIEEMADFITQYQLSGMFTILRLVGISEDKLYEFGKSNYYKLYEGIYKML